MVRYTTNPKTGRKIIVDGPAYLELAKNPYWAKKLKPKPSAALRKKPRKGSSSKSAGSSNQRKYVRSGLPPSMFCGPAGGAAPYTYPVNTRSRAIAAKSYARHAPNPAGIKRCADRMAKKKGWTDPKTGKIRRSGRGGSKKKSASKKKSKKKNGSKKKKSSRRR